MKNRQLDNWQKRFSSVLYALLNKFDNNHLALIFVINGSAIFIDGQNSSTMPAVKPTPGIYWSLANDMDIYGFYLFNKTRFIYGA